MATSGPPMSILATTFGAPRSMSPAGSGRKLEICHSIWATSIISMRRKASAQTTASSSQRQIIRFVTRTHPRNALLLRSRLQPNQKTATFVAGGFKVSLPQGFRGVRRCGLSILSRTENAFEDLAWTAGLSYTWKQLTFDVRYWDTNLSRPGVRCSQRT